MKGSDIVKEFMAEHLVCADDLFESRFSEHVALRAKCIRRLRDAGIGTHAAARAMCCDPQTIRYWACGERRNREIAKRILYYPKTKKFQALALALEELYA